MTSGSSLSPRKSGLENAAEAREAGVMASFSSSAQRTRSRMSGLRLCKKHVTFLRHASLMPCLSAPSYLGSP